MQGRILATLALALVGTSCISLADGDCRYTAPRDAAIAVEGATRVRVIARAGSLRIDGRPGLGEVRASGTACASRESLLDDVKLVARRSGDEVVLEVRLPRSSGWSARTGLDLTVEVPDNLPLEVDDSSGSIEIENVGPLRLEDGSGDIWVEGVGGDLTLVDGSGSIDVAGVRGNAQVEDGSGGIELSRIDGRVEIEDGSGAIDVRQVGRDVIIDDDGSGDIDVADVQGSFLVRDDGSGDIVASDIGGDFTVESGGSGRIRHYRVGGRVSVPAD